MDAASVRRAAAEDPVGFVAGLDLPVAIDEIQRAPELLLEVKRVVDQDPRPGQFLLTSSARVLSLPRVADALVGRIETVTLWPVSQAEVEGTKTNLVDSLFERDVRDLSDIRAVDEVPALLTLVASRSTAPLNIAALAADLRVSEASARRYLSLLRAVFALLRVPSWRRNLGRRATAAPKYQPVDSGLAAHLLSLSRHRLAADESLAGGLFEGFVRMEIVKQAEWSSASLSPRDFRGLEALRDERGDAFVAGVVIHAGEQTLPFGDRLWALPVSALWS